MTDITENFMTCRHYKRMKISKTIITAIFCLYLGAIAFLCFMKTDSVPEMQFTIFGLQTDKIAHFCMFAPYPILAFQTFHEQESTIWQEMLLLGILVISGAGLAYGTEQLQGLTDYRSYEMADFHADTLGLAAGTAAVLLQTVFRRR